MTTYLFEINLEPDAEGWRAYYAPLQSIGASTWGKSKEEALSKQEVLSLIVDELAEEENRLSARDRLAVSDRLLVAVSR